MFGDKYLRLADMENRRQTPTQPSMASRLLSTFESAGLAATATFASVLWIGLALPGLPLLPGVGGGQNSNVAISLSSAVLGVQDSRTFAPSSGVAGRQARLLSLLLPAPDTLSKDLATKRPDATALPGASMVVALPAPPAQDAAPDSGPRVTESSQLASTSSAPAPSPPAPPPPAPVSLPPPPRAPDPDPQTPAPPTLPIDPPPPSDPDVSSPQTPDPEDTPGEAVSPAGTTPPDPGSDPNAGGSNAGGNNPNAGGANAGGNGNGNGNGNAGGNNPNAGGKNPNAGGANAGGNGNSNGNGNGNAGGNNPNAGGNNPNAGGANAGGNGKGNGNGNGNGNGAPKGSPKKGP